MLSLLVILALLFIREVQHRLRQKKHALDSFLASSTKYKAIKEKIQLDNDHKRQEITRLTESLPGKNLKIIQLLTSNNKSSTQIQSLENQLSQVKNEHDAVSIELGQVTELARSLGIDKQQKLRNLEIEKAVMSSDLQRQKERLQKYNTSNQKIVRAINETTIKNFEIGKECEDSLLYTVKDIQSENIRLRGIGEKVSTEVDQCKGEVYETLKKVTDRVAQFVAQTNFQKKRLEFVNSRVDIVEMMIEEKMKGERNEMVSQKKFELESLEFELGESRRKLSS